MMIIKYIFITFTYKSSLLFAQIFKCRFLSVNCGGISVQHDVNQVKIQISNRIIINPNSFGVKYFWLLKNEK